MGPLELLDLVGLDTQLLLCEALHASTHDPRAACPPLVKRMIAAGHLGRKSGRGFHVYKDAQDVRSLSMAYSHHRHRQEPLLSRGRMRCSQGAAAAGDVVIVIGAEVGAAFARLRTAEPRRRSSLELGTECLGVHTGESRGTEGSNVLGFARYRLGDAEPTNLVELVRQPQHQAGRARRSEGRVRGSGLVVAVCNDFPGASSTG